MNDNAHVIMIWKKDQIINNILKNNVTIDKE
jgi:hypothetical protein